MLFASSFYFIQFTDESFKKVEYHLINTMDMTKMAKYTSI